MSDGATEMLLDERPVVIGNATLYRADCMDVMRGLPDKAFDLAIVDPPYGIGIGSSVGGGKPFGSKGNGGGARLSHPKSIEGSMILESPKKTISVKLSGLAKTGLFGVRITLRSTLETHRAGLFGIKTIQAISRIASLRLPHTKLLSANLNTGGTGCFRAT